MSDPIRCQEAALFPAAIVHGGVVGRGVLNGLHPGLFHVALEFASVRGTHDAKFSPILEDLQPLQAMWRVRSLVPDTRL